MNTQVIAYIFLFNFFLAHIQVADELYPFSHNDEHPYGQYNHAEPVSMIWTFRYILNGTAVQDDTLKSDGSHSGSIRQFNSATKKWHVHYYTSKSVVDELPVWYGGLEGNDLVF